MKPADYDAFVKVVAGFAELKGKHLSAQAIELYWRSMQHWSIDDFRAAAEHLLRTSEFMPIPKHFEDLRRAGALTGAEAWTLVLEHIKGAYRDGSGIDSGGPIDRSVAGIGGYRALAFQKVEYLPMSERQFSERFGELTDATAARKALPQIAQFQHRGQLAIAQRIDRVLLAFDEKPA